MACWGPNPSQLYGRQKQYHCAFTLAPMLFYFQSIHYMRVLCGQKYISTYLSFYLEVNNLEILSGHFKIFIIDNHYLARVRLIQQPSGNKVSYCK